MGCNPEECEMVSRKFYKGLLDHDNYIVLVLRVDLIMGLPLLCYSSRQSPKMNGFHETDTWSRSFKAMSEKVLDFLYRIVYYDTGIENSPVN